MEKNNFKSEFIIKKENSKIEISGNKHFSNEIKTTKYTLLNFLPWSIFYQFKKYPNIYFLLLSIIVYIPNITSINPFFRLLTFSAVLSISLLKELILDIKRFIENLKINDKNIELIRDNKLIKSNYKSIKHGDIIKLKENDNVPADIIILCSGINEKNTFIETSSLDGEKTLKPKYFIDDINNYFYNKNFNFSNLNYKFKTSKPNSSINNMNGNITFNNKSYNITNKQFIPRGCKIKDINNIYVLVILIGHDTKIMLNTAKKRNKLSHMEQKMNLFIIYIFIFQFFLLILSIILNYIFNTVYNRFQFQGYTNENKVSLAFINFLSYLILLANIIPISLIVTIELSRIAQGIFIYLDNDMYDFERNIRQKVFTVNINEELGQINFILSDKTGTLTINKMDLNFLNIGFSLFNTYILKDFKIKNFEDILKLKINNIYDFLNIQNNDKNKINFPIKFYSEDKIENIKFENEKDFFYFFMIFLLTCHDCFIKKDNKNLIYNGESPDEIAFLKKLKELNIKIIDISENFIKIQIFEEEIILKKLGIIEFDNDRKCMSVIINYKFKKDDKNILFIKGADNSLFNKSNKNYIFHDIINKSVNHFSNKGLRILVFGFKIFSNEELNKFLIDYKKYKLSNDINNIINWENNINLIGSTAVEDKLIPGLNKIIKKIKNSNIKIWILTGDKLETAKQIGFSCKLLDNKKSLFSIKNVNDFNEFLKLKNDSNFNKNKEKYSFIIEGNLVNKIFKNKKFSKEFYNIIKYFKSCIFSRITPIQKALIVELVKSEKNITWAIGDGANDVSMIQKADIGVGIFGNEGRQAVINSDYAIPDFTKLESLLFKHGRLFYLRMSKTMLYFFYKSIILVMNAFWFGFYSGFNGYNIYIDYYYLVYNSIVTAFPLILRVIMEQNILDYKIEYKNNNNKLFNYLNWTNMNKFIVINKKIKKIYPFWFKIGKNNKIFTFKKFIGMFILSLFESFFIFIITIYSFYNFQNDQVIILICLITIIFINVNLKLTFETNFIWIGHIFITFILSISIYIIMVYSYQNINIMIYFSINFYINNLTFYLVIILGILFLLSLTFAFKLINIHIFPSEIEIIEKHINYNLKNNKNLIKLLEKNEKESKFYHYPNFINNY